jgi:ATP-dependent helicase HrpA
MSEDLKHQLRALGQQIDQAMLRDRFVLRRDLSRLQDVAKAGEVAADKIERLQQRLEKSVSALKARLAVDVAIRYPEELPVAQRAADIAAAVRDHQVVIVAGETGSGKTTQLPKICLELGRGRAGMIGHTQPRRIAARSVAARIASELGSTVGDVVGYQVRFTDQVSERSLIKLMTDGILLAEIANDRFLQRYDTLIIDEVHERSLNIDFILGYLQQLLPKRRDLKVIITSATIDIERISRHFEGAPVVEVSGRTFPVEIVYRPPLDYGDDVDQPQAVLNALQELMTVEREQQRMPAARDVLVFLPGEREIRETALAMRKANLPHCEVLPLYARLSAAEQNRIFDISGTRTGRRIVLATNVAETSVTVPGIGYVIDTGVARINRYSVRSKIQRLPIEPISQASANQRAGRCGRVADGVCIRLYEEDDFNRRAPFTDAEILRVSLASVILQMLHLQLGDIASFPFIDPPDKRQINDGFKQLEELGAVDTRRQLTNIGKKLATMPVDPRVARMVLAGARENCLHEILIIASALSVQDPRERPADKQQAADEKHRRFNDEHSDFLALVNLWNYFEEQRQQLSKTQLRKQCQREFLSPVRMQEWRDIHFQLRISARALNLRENDKPADLRSIHRALLAALPSQIGIKTEDRKYLGARNREFRIFPASGLYKKSPKWLVAAQLLETTQLYAHTIGRIEPEWLNGVADHLFRYQYSEPHWSAKRGQVVANQKTTLYGLTVNDKQTVSYAKIDMMQSREIFIRAALVEGQWQCDAPFWQHNENERKALELLEAKARRRDIIAEDEALFAFYDARVPPDVCNTVAFHQWREQAERDEPQLLFVDRAILLRGDVSAITAVQFPDSIVWEDNEYPLRYRFEPGHAEDGVSVVVPLGLLNRVPKHRFDYLVPGLLRDKCIALVKALPKSLRREFVPVPDYVDRALTHVVPDNVPLTMALGKALLKLKGTQIPDAAWDQVVIDDFYRVNFIVVDANGETLGQGRKLEPLLDQFREAARERLQPVRDSGPGWQKSGLHRWDFGDLPRTHRFTQAGVEITAYPALRDDGDSASIALFDYAWQAQQAHRFGVARLLMLTLSQQTRYLKKELLRGNALSLHLGAIGSRDAIIGDVVQAAFVATFLDRGTVARPGVIAAELPFSQSAFDQCLERGRSELVATAQQIETVIANIAQLVFTLSPLLAKPEPKPLAATYADMRAQFAALVHEGFIAAAPSHWLMQYPRYLQAMLQRLQKASGQVQKEQTLAGELKALVEPLRAQLLADPQLPLKVPEIAIFRWMLEEYRVSLFAQQLGTQMPVSNKRLQSSWQEVLTAIRTSTRH